MLEFGSLVVMSEPFEGKVWGLRAATDARPSSLTQAWLRECLSSILRFSALAGQSLGHSGQHLH